MLYLFCLFFGAIGPVNNMLNVKAGQCLGTARGALINYAEATILSALLIFLMGLGQELAPILPAFLRFIIAEAFSVCWLWDSSSQPPQKPVWFSAPSA